MINLLFYILYAIYLLKSWKSGMELDENVGSQLWTNVFHLWLNMTHTMAAKTAGKE